MENEIKYRKQLLVYICNLFFNFTCFVRSAKTSWFKVAIQQKILNDKRLLLSVTQHNSIAFVIALGALRTFVHDTRRTANYLRFIESYSSCRTIISS